MRGVCSFMCWHQVPDFDSLSSSNDDNPFAGSRTQPTGKVSIQLQADDWLCRKLEKLNLTIAEGYPSRNAETAGLLRDQFKTPRTSWWYDMHTNKKDASTSKVLYWSSDPAKLNSAFSRVARHSLPCAPASRFINQDTLSHWERSAREQTYMCNQAAGLSRCLTKVQDAMVTQLRTLQLDKGKGKAPGRSQEAVDELDYLLTFNRSITQAMGRTMQDLSEGVFVNMASFSLARWDSYLQYLRNGVKQDTITALCTAPLHNHSLFPDQLLLKQKRSSQEMKRGLLLAVHTGSPIVFTPMLLQLPSHLINGTRSLVYQPGSR